MATCQKCGATDWDVARVVGALEVLKCRRCGAEETVHTYYPNQQQTKADESWFVLRIDLTSALTAEQIQALRQLFRKLELMSSAAIKKAAMAGESLDLGQYPKSEVDTLIRQAKSIGISLHQSQASAPAFNKQKPGL